MRKLTVLLVLSGLLVAWGAAVLAQGPAAAPATTPAAPAMAPAMLAPMLSPTPCILQALRLLHPQLMPFLAKRLNLTDAQKTQIADLLTKSEDAIKPKIEEQRKAAADFAIAMAKSDTTEAALLAAAEKAQKAEMAIIADRIKTLVAVRAAFTDQQKTDFTQFVEQRTMIWRGEAFPPRPMPPAKPVPNGPAPAEPATPTGAAK